MAKCEYCGKEVLYPFKCSFCGFYFCAEHRLPENHDCPNLPTRTPLGQWKAKKHPLVKLPKTLKSNVQKTVKKEGKLYFIKERTRGVSINQKILRSHITVKIGLALFAILLFEHFFMKAYFNNTIYIFVALATIYLIYKLFLIASRIRVTSDLRLWGLRILSGLVFIVGILFLAGVLMSYVVLALTPEKLDNPAFMSVFVFFGVLGLGLIFLSSYLIFRFMLKSGVIVYPR